MQRLFAVAIAALFAVGALPRDTRAEEAKLTVNVFPGISNLPLYAAQAKGFFAKRGLDVEIKYTPNSDAQRKGLADGSFQIAHTAVDNAFALKDKANVDVVVVLGGDNSFNHLIVQPDIASLPDIKGKTLVVDAPNTAFAFQLYEMLRLQGVVKGDYQVKPAGSSNARLEAMLKDKSMAAAMMSPPFTLRATKAGLKDMGRAVDALGAYQGQAAVVLRPWAQRNADTLVKYLQAYVEGWRWAFDAKNRAEVIALLSDKLKAPEDVVVATFDGTQNDFDRDGAIDMEGVRNVLKLRAEFTGGTPASPDRYLDLSYYKKALQGL